jgi:DNA-directed RNA polymerase subunit M/transcription elongation factor TFIIS
MKLAFTCPDTQKSFHSDKYDIVENRGVTHDLQGNKILDARVRLSEKCPACGRRHVYAVAELACPFSPSDYSQG